MTYFTPEPWIPRQVRGGFSYTIHGPEFIVCERVHLEANADLIAAAPAMYKALRNVLEICEAGDTGASFERVIAAMQIANEALAKAEGRE